MHLYLALGYPEAVGGVKSIGEGMRLYLCTWSPEIKSSPNSQFVGGDIQWQMFSEYPMHLKILLSYWYYKNADLDALFAKYFTPPYPEIFADSGAFSAMTQGAHITIKEYVDWIKRWEHLFTVYSNLDVIKNAEATWENQQRLEDLGVRPIPCFHVLEDFKWLEHYIQRYPYIALGVAGM